MPLLTAEQILSADDVVWENVDCPEWGGVVRLYCLNGVERAQLNAQWKPESKHYRELMLWFCARDDSGNRLFTDFKQIEALGKKSSVPLERCFEVALRLNGIGKEDEAKKKLLNSSGGSDSPA